MSRKKRRLRVGCLVLALLGFVGYVAFSTFVFPPFERRFNAGVAGLVPRTVDFFLGRTGLREAFSEFPRLAVLDELKGHPALETFVDSPEWIEFKRVNGVDEGLAQLEAALDRLPLGLDPLGIFGGNEIALAGNFVGQGVERTDWAVYGRVSRVGKLALAGLRYPGLLKLDQQGLEVKQVGEVFTLTGSSLKRPMHVARVRDVVIAGTGADLVARALTLADAGSEDSLLMAAPYGEHVLGIPNRDPERHDFEVVLDVRALREKWGLTKPWPDVTSQRFLPAFTGRMFQLGATNRVLGVLAFDAGLSLDLYGELSSELVTPEQARIYRSRSFDHKALEAIARGAHEDTTFMAYMHGPIGTMLDMVVQAMEPAMRDNLVDALKKTGRYKALPELVKDLDDGMHDRLALLARPNDWGYEKDYKRKPNGEVELDDEGQPIYEGPPFTPADVFAWTLVVWHENEKKLIDLRELIGANYQTFGLRGRAPGESGYYEFSIAGNFPTREFWSRLVPGTGHIATVNLPEHMMVTNRYMMLEDITQNLLQPRSSRTGRLTDRSDFVALLEEMPASGNLFVWSNPGSASDLLQRQAETAARARVESSVALEQKRREFEPAARQAAVQGKARSVLNQDEINLLEAELDRRVGEYRDNVLRESVPRALEAARRQVTYLRSISAFMLMLDVDEKDFRLGVRAVTPLGQR
jgi:hypothetical protein